MGIDSPDGQDLPASRPRNVPSGGVDSVWHDEARCSKGGIEVIKSLACRMADEDEAGQGPVVAFAPDPRRTAQGLGHVVHVEGDGQGREPARQPRRAGPMLVHDDEIGPDLAHNGCDGAHPPEGRPPVKPAQAHIVEKARRIGADHGHRAPMAAMQHAVAGAQIDRGRAVGSEMHVAGEDDGDAHGFFERLEAAQGLDDFPQGRNVARCGPPLPGRPGIRVVATIGSAACC